MKKIKDILIFIFGESPKKRFKRIVMTILLLAFVVISTLNVGCGFKDGKFYFEWKPAATIQINK